VDDVSELQARLATLRPLRADQIAALFPHLVAENALFVYESNAIEGSTLTLGETIAVVEEGLTIAGKPLRDHLDAVNGSAAYHLMLDLAQTRREIELDTILALHRAVVGSAAYGGRLRDQPVYIRGSRHVPPNHIKVSSLMEAMVAAMRPSQILHPVERAARAHFDLLTIHPFVDGNGRTARLLQNLVLIGAGFAPITIAAHERPRYFDVLQAAQVAIPGSGNARLFVPYIAELELRELRRYLDVLDSDG